MSTVCFLARACRRFAFSAPLGVAAIGFSGLSSCQQTTSQLSLTLSPQSTYLIDANAFSCTDAQNSSITRPITGSVTPFYFRFNKFKIGWSGTGTLAISFLQLTISDPNINSGSYVCVIPISDLDYLTNSDVTNIQPNATLSPSGPSSTPGATTQCFMTCGGISLADPSQPVTATGTAILVGVATDSSGNQTPQQVQTSFTVVNMGY